MGGADWFRGCPRWAGMSRKSPNRVGSMETPQGYRVVFAVRVSLHSIGAWHR